MARVFLRLKLRLLRNRLARSDVVGLVGFVLIWIGAVGGGGISGVLLALLLRVAPLGEEGVRLVTVAVFSVVALLWVLVPLVAASIDDALEPRRFEHLPLRPWQLAWGLLVAGAAGPGGLATLLGLGVGTLGGLGSPAAALPQLMVVVVATLLVSATARWITTLLSDLLRSRRTQEVAALVLGLLLGLPAVLGGFLAERGSEVGGGARTAAEVLAWLPPGALGWSAFELGRGSWVRGTLLLGYGGAAAGAAVWATGRAVARLQRRAPGAGAPRRRRVLAGEASLPFARLPLPASPVGAVAAKELRYLWRDVRMRSQLLGSSVALVAVGFAVGRPLLETPYAPFLSGVAAFLLVASVIPNQFGFDGGSFWGYLTTVPRLSDVLRGKNLAWALLAAPTTVLVALAGAVASGAYAFLPAALLVGLGILLVWMAVGNVTSVLGAYALPESNLFANRAVSGTVMLHSLAGLTVSGFLTLPLLALAAVPAVVWGPSWAAGGAAFGLAYTWLVYRLGLRLAGRLLEGRALRLVEILDQP